MRVLVWIVLLGIMGGPVRAQPAPWAIGVSDEEQAAALEIYNAGNAEFEQGRYEQALAKYRDAIKHWDHPAIRFNMAVCLINLEDRRAALDSLELALRFGATPLGAAMYGQGLTYKKLLLQQLSRLQLSCKETGADVSLDGHKLFTAPGDVTLYVPPGGHQIVAEKPGYLTETMSLLLEPGMVAVRDIHLAVAGAPIVDTRGKIALGANLLVDATTYGAAGLVSAAYGITNQLDVGAGAIIGEHPGAFVSGTFSLTRGEIRPILAVATPTFLVGGTLRPGVRGALGVEWIPRLRFGVVFQLGVEYYPSAQMGETKTVLAPTLGIQSRL